MKISELKDIEKEFLQLYTDRKYIKDEEYEAAVEPLFEISEKRDNHINLIKKCKRVKNNVT